MQTSLGGSLLKFLVDTGSDISLVKENCVTVKKGLNRTNVFNISGVGSGVHTTLGEIGTKIVVSDCTEIYHQLHVVDSEFPVQTDGILGRDFLTMFRCKLDYESWILSFKVNGYDIEIPIQNQFGKCKRGSEIIIPPRTEKVQAINLELEEDCVVHKRELVKGVFLASVVVPKNGFKHVQIVNTTDEEIIIPSFDVSYEPLKDYLCVQHNTDLSLNDRKKRVRELCSAKLSEHAEADRESVVQICESFSDIFHLPGDKLSVNNFYEQEIQLVDKKPLYRKNYRLPEAQKPVIKKHIDKLLSDEIIEPSVSAYNSPVLLVPKKGETEDGEKKTRLVIDFRGLNEKICSDKFPLPRIQEILDLLGRARYFSVLDAASGFHQISLAKNSRHLTAFSTDAGHFQFTRLPFGIKIAPSSFSRMMAIALAGLDSRAFCYIDDVIVFGSSLRHHNINLGKVFQRLRECNLKLNPDKCVFLKREVIYLGHKVTSHGVYPDPSKFHVIKNYPTPKTVKDVQRFVAFANYYRKFISNFAEKAMPLNQLLRKNVVFEWTDERKKAFETLKYCLMNPPVLQYPDFTKPFILTTDSSSFAFGAVLSQGTVGSDKPVAYASRGMNKHELKKPVIEKELLAIHWAIQYFRPILYGRKFFVYTDHRPLVSLFSQKDPSSKMTRVRLDLEEYDFTVTYKPGKFNCNADALSRIKIDTAYLRSLIPRDVDSLVLTRSMSKLKNAEISSGSESSKERNFETKPDQLRIWNATSLSDVQGLKKCYFEIKSDNVANSKLSCKNEIVIHEEIDGYRVVLRLSNNSTPDLGRVLETLDRRISTSNLALSRADKIFDYVSVNELVKILNKAPVQQLKFVLYSPPECISDEEKQKEIISSFHSSELGHFGLKKTLARIKQRFFWKRMGKMVSDYVQRCKACQLNKVTKHNHEKLQVTTTPTTSFETVEIDLIGPLPMTENGHRYAVTFQCNLTKFVDAVPIADKSAKTVATAIVENFFCKYGMSPKIKTDLGTEFVNELLTEICKILNVNHKTSTAFHHETLGSLERNHRVLNEFLRIHNEAKDSSWDKWIPFYCLSYNSTPLSTVNYTPFELIFGKLPQLPNIDSTAVPPFLTLTEYGKDIQQRLSITHNKVAEMMNKIKQKQCDEANTELKSPLIFNTGDVVKLRIENRRKLDPFYSGPYVVINTNGVNTMIKNSDTGKISVVHNNRLLFFKPP